MFLAGGMSKMYLGISSCGELMDIKVLRVNRIYNQKLYTII